ncbi:hypothetical protein [Metallibacterium scheffleri]|uniref:hypothetical protein n=1 Tax=Metallibacterium scheffleri TaxID=993689 RepID=UPI0010A0986A|nr:hypothetical protein [Metallibacterium scheffleri]
MKMHYATLGVILAALAGASVAQQTPAQLGKPTTAMQVKAASAIGLRAYLPFNAMSNTAKSATAPTPIKVQMGTFDAATQTVVLPDGVRIPMNELSPNYTANTPAALGARVNPGNLQASGQAATERMAGSGDINAQAWRTSTQAGSMAGGYGAQTALLGQAVQPVQGTPGALGSIGLSPNLYFVGAQDVVLVGVDLTGGYGPAQVRYETTGASLPPNLYRPVSGTLTWPRGQGGVRYIAVPVAASTIQAARATGEIDLTLFGASGAELSGASTARIVAGEGGGGVTLPGCGAAGLNCQGQTSPGAGTVDLKPVSPSVPVKLPGTGPCVQAGAQAGKSTVSIACP